MLWKKMTMYPLLPTAKKTRICIGTIFSCIFLVLISPNIPHTPKHHSFADMRNFLGVPNTLNVITNFPFLIVGVLGLVLCLQRSFFVISLRGEAWGWVLFYAGIVGTAFGSAYYHLDPDDGRVIYDQLPMMIVYASLLSNLVVERVGVRIGVTCLASLIVIALVGIVFERNYDDLRLCMLFQLIPSVAIPYLVYCYLPKYTHSRYWLWATGAYILAKVEACADRKIYGMSHYIISGHSLEHLCLAMVPVFLFVMLMFRNFRFPRLGDLKETLGK